MLRIGRIGLAGVLTGLVLVSGPDVSNAVAADEGLRRIGAHVEINDDAMPGLLAGGAEVKVSGHSSGRVVLIGADVALDAAIADSLYVLAANAKIAGSTKGGVEIAAGRLTVNSVIDGNLYAAASRIQIDKGTKIGGTANLTGSSITFAGESTGTTTLEASEVEFSGAAKGPLQIEAPHVHFTDSAVIDGDVELYTISEPVIDAGAKITGHVNRRSLSNISASRALEAAGPFGRLFFGLFLLGSALMAGLMFLWLGRGGAEGAIDELIDSPASSGLWGIAAMIGLPVAALVLAFTIIGAPVGALALLALPLLLLLGFACAGLGVGEWLFNRLGEPRSASVRALHLIVGLLVLCVLGLIPWAGPAVLVVATLCGFGALIRTLHDRMRAGGTA